MVDCNTKSREYGIALLLSLNEPRLGGIERYRTTRCRSPRQRKRRGDITPVPHVARDTIAPDKYNMTKSTRVRVRGYDRKQN